MVAHSYFPASVSKCALCMGRDFSQTHTCDGVYNLQSPVFIILLLQQIFMLMTPVFSRLLHRCQNPILQLHQEALGSTFFCVAWTIFMSLYPALIAKSAEPIPLHFTSTAGCTILLQCFCTVNICFSLFFLYQVELTLLYPRTMVNSSPFLESEAVERGS